MKTALKYGTPLASPARFPVAGVMRRGLREVSREVVSRRKFDLFFAVERAFFPRYFWTVACGMLDYDEADGRAVINALLDDQQEWADLMLPSQQVDFTRELARLVDDVMPVMLDRQIGGGGGWKTSRLLMVGFGLCLLADDYASDAVFTTRFKAMLNCMASQYHFLAGDEMKAMEPAAHRSLRKVIALLKSKNRFLWLPDYHEARFYDDAQEGGE